METYIVRINGIEYEVEIEKKGKQHHQSISESVSAKKAAEQQSAAPAPAAQKAAAPAAGSGTPAVCGTSGKVWKIEKAVGDEVKKGDAVVIIEAMKMEIPVVAPVDGKVTQIAVGEGDAVASGQAVAYIG